MRFVSILSVVLCVAAACHGAPSSLEIDEQVTIRNLQNDAVFGEITNTYGWSDFWGKVGEAINNAVDKVKATGEKLADKISEEFDELKDQINQIVAPEKAKVNVIMQEVMPVLAEKAKLIIKDARKLAKEVGLATLEILKKLGHDALVEAQKWLDENHELVEKLLFEFLTEQLPKLIKDSISGSTTLAPYNGWTDFWGKVGNAIKTAAQAVKTAGGKFVDKVNAEFIKIADKINQIVAPIKAKVDMIFRDIVPKMMDEAVKLIKDAKERATQVGKAALDTIKRLGHDALLIAKKWLDENHELVEKLLFKFLTEVLPKIIQQAVARSNQLSYNGWTDFWGKVGNAIENAIQKVKDTGANLADKISEEFDALKEKVNEIVAPIKIKVQTILRDVMPKIAAKAKIVIKDARELAKQVGTATLQLLKKLGHDALIEAQKWLEANHELVEKLLFKFLTEQLPKIIKDAMANNYAVARPFNGWTDFWEKVGQKINNAVEKVKETGHNLAEKIGEEFDELKDKVNSIVAPIKVKVQVILKDVMPVIASKAKIVFHDAKELARQVGAATLELLKKLGHDALVEAQKWLNNNHELVEKILFKFLTEQLPKMIKDSMKSYSLTQYNGWTDFWKKVGDAIDKAVGKVKATGEKLADKISEEFDELKDKVNAIIAPVKTKVQIILRDVMPKIAAKAKIVIRDAKELAKQVGTATLQLLKKLGHDALIEAQKWLEANHELVEKLLFKFLTEQLPKIIKDAMATNYALARPFNGWTDFWDKVGQKINNAVEKVKETGQNLAEKIGEEFDELKDKINVIVAPIKVKVQVILRDVMPIIASKAKIVFHDAKELARQVGAATLELLKKLGHDALVEAQKWLNNNHELVEKLLFKFLTEQLPKMIRDAVKSYSLIQYNGWTDFWEKVGNAIDKAVNKVKATGEKLADKISEEFDEFKDRVNAIIAPVKTKVQIILRDVMPKIAAKAKIVIRDAKELAKQVGSATLAILKKLGHDALIEAQKWLAANHELVEKLLFKFLTEQLPKLIKDSLASSSALTTYGWTDFWEKVGNAIDKAVNKVKATGEKLADKISEEFDEIKEKINAILAPVKTKVQIILRDIMPKIAAKAKIIIKDGKELAKQVGTATLALLKKLGHDALIEAQKWLAKNHELVEKLLYKFLTEQLPKLIKDSLASSYSLTTYGWTDFWEKVGNAIEKAVNKVKATGEKLADKIAEEFDELKEKVNAIIAPVKTKVQIILRDIMPKIAAKAKVVIKDTKELAKQVGTATLAILKKLGHDALIEAQKWLSENHELVEKLLFKFLTEQLPKLIKDSLASSYSLTTYGWSDFWEKVGDAINKAVNKAKDAGKHLAEKISNEFDELKEKINAIVAPIKTKVVLIMEDLMPKIAAKAKLIIKDAKKLAEQVGLATISILKKLGHDALLYAQKWLAENKDLVEKLIFEFLTEQLPKIIRQGSLHF